MSRRRSQAYVRAIVLEIAAETAESADQLVGYLSSTLPDNDYGARMIIRARARNGDDGAVMPAAGMKINADLIAEYRRQRAAYDAAGEAENAELAADIEDEMAMTAQAIADAAADGAAS